MLVSVPDDSQPGDTAPGDTASSGTASGGPPSLLLVTGDEELLVSRALGDFRAAARAADPEAEIAEVTGSQLTDDQIMDSTAPACSARCGC